MTAPTLSAKATLRAAMPALGFKVSLDFADIWNGLLHRAKVVKSSTLVTPEDMKAIIPAWVAWVESLRTADRGGTDTECYAVIRAALLRAS